jgi:hypothetical protein
VANLRKCIGQLTQFLREDPSEKVKRASAKILLKYKHNNDNTTTDVLDRLKQTLLATTKRLKRYRKSNSRRVDNKNFSNSERQFYRNLTSTDNAITNQDNANMSANSVQQFWSSIWSTPVTHKNAAWISREKRLMGIHGAMKGYKVSLDELKNAIKKTHNWKAPGCDNVHNYWYKHFTSTHQNIANSFSDILENPDQMPLFMTKGTTYLLPKTSPPSDDPSKYRPITSLPTLYKLLTSVITNKIYEHLDRNDVLTQEQNGCRKRAQGCKELLNIDAVITGNAKSTKQPLYTAYIDYQKAFDSIPHTWLVEVLNIYRVDPVIVKFLEVTMQTWETKLLYRSKDNQTEAGDIKIQKGIFQGDALSALWFCLCLNPLSRHLNTMKGYKIQNTNITHLLYMDDLKLYAGSKEDLTKQLQWTEKFSQDLDMKFGIDKCRTNAMIRGKWEDQEGHKTKDELEIKGMDAYELYKYLGYLQSKGIDHKVTKQQLTAKFQERLELVLKTDLNSKYIIKAINTYAISILTYSFGVIQWTHTELQALDRLVRTKATKHKIHHPRSAMERLYLPRVKGGRGLINISNLHYSQIDLLREYFREKSVISIMHSTISKHDNKITPLNLRDATYNTDELKTSHTAMQEKWSAKPMHGRYPAVVNADHVDSTATFNWIRDGYIFSETEGFMLAIQDQVIATKYYQKHIIHAVSVLNDKCRLCINKPETIDHITGACTSLASVEYTRRHDNVAKILHQQICKRINPEGLNEPYHKYIPLNVIEDNEQKIYWNRDIITDKTIPHNRPDIVVTNKINKTTYLIDIAIPNAANIAVKNSEKLRKYSPLAMEIKEMWHQDKVVTIPIIIGSTGEIPKLLFKNLQLININEAIYKKMQKSVVIDTCSIVRQFLGNETQF